MPSADRQRAKNKRVEDEASHIATKKGERIVIPLWVPLATLLLFSLAVVATAKFLYLESRKKAKLAETAAKKVREEAREAQKRASEELEEWSDSDSDEDSDEDGYTDDSSSGSGGSSGSTSDSRR